MPWWGWVSLIAAIIGIAWAIDTWLLPKPVIRSLILRLFSKDEKRPPKTGGGDEGHGITLQIPTPPTGSGRVVVTIDYLDGLPDAPPKIRDPFLEGQRLEKESKYREAIRRYEQCFQAETTASEYTALHGLIGNCFFRLSELEEAEGHYREAEAAAKEAQDKEGLAAALGNIGNIYLTKGDLDKALDYHQQALKINKEIGRKEGEASDLGNIGIIYKTKGELDKALDYHQQALNIDKEMGNREGEASNLGNIGLVYAEKGKPDKALEYLEQALKIFERIGAKIEIEKTKQNIQEIKEGMKKTRGQDSGTV